MANRIQTPPMTGTQWHTLDTTTAAPTPGTPGFFGQAYDSKIGSFMFQVEGNGWTGELVPYGYLPGAVGASMGAIALAYQDLNTGNDVAGGTAITADGIYAVRADHGMMVYLAYTHTGGSVDILATEGIG